MSGLLQADAGPVAERVAAIDALLPQTQCTQCGYSGCEPYAAAIDAGEADINQCPPGGDLGIHKLAKLLRVDYKPLNPVHGVYKPRAVALIVEADCIGCTLCIQACPVDAILGAAKAMHSVLSDECTGCELCIAPCPVDCIRMVPCAERDAATTEQAAMRARQRFHFRRARLDSRQAAAAARMADKARGKRHPPAIPAASPSPVAAAQTADREPVAEPPQSDKSARIRAMMERAQALRANAAGS